MPEISRLIETPVENAPPVIGAVNIPEYARSYCDIWGNIQKEPVKILEEAHGPNFVKVFIFYTEQGFFYGYQIKLEKLILQKKANINDIPLQAEREALNTARNELIAVTTEKRLLKVFTTFDTICYNQPELF
jgi:hypothetical protein